jgi:hypothetical protein
VPMLASERARIEASGGMVTKHLPCPPASPIPYPSAAHAAPSTTLMPCVCWWGWDGCTYRDVQGSG